VGHPAADKVYHISCHCMSAIGAPTHPDAGQERADFCLGNIHLGQPTSSAGVVEFVAKTIRDQGFTRTINMPYGGGETNRRYDMRPHWSLRRTVRNIHGCLQRTALSLICSVSGNPAVNTMWSGCGRAPTDAPIGCAGTNPQRRPVNGFFTRKLTCGVSFFQIA